ncbi:MAG: Gfo/Idh/MocA family oxidoreductase [Anaerolineales bacterium]|nr:Gfo/Idh/MocA family oxidoreductase [Anaerolineales bacterium]
MKSATSKGRAPLRLVLVGAGGMMRHHITDLLKMRDRVEVVAIAEPDDKQARLTRAVFVAGGVKPPTRIRELDGLLKRVKADAAFIASPHVYHHDQTVACLETGLDVLLEKPMVMNGEEARSLIEARDRTGRLLVVAFPGSLSPSIRLAGGWLRSGGLGPIRAITGMAFQDWAVNTVGTWRQRPEISGGGFLFDTGAHLLNTVCDLAGEDFVEVSATLSDDGYPVEVRGAVRGVLRSGALVTLMAAGVCPPGVIGSQIDVFAEQAVIRTGIWGERLEVWRSRGPGLRKVRLPRSLGVVDTFLAVRAGEIENPCPPEVGLRMARLYDAIVASSTRGGAAIKLEKTRPSRPR